MRELPIILCPEMVKALKEGRKTQTRRIIVCEEMRPLGPHGCMWPYHRGKEIPDMPGGHVWEPVKPRYQVGDELWVKETWRCTGGGSWKGVLHKSSGPETAMSYAGVNDGRAITVPEEFWPQWDRLVYETDTSCNWRSPRYMFKWAAGLWLRVTAVKDPHQIQNISEEDAKAEGADCDVYDEIGPEGRIIEHPCYVPGFMHLWNRLHPKPGERFEDGPWVFPYVIERVER